MALIYLINCENKQTVANKNYISAIKSIREYNYWYHSDAVVSSLIVIFTGLHCYTIM